MPDVFALTCRCGQRIEGERTTTFRDVACPRCRRKVYVFPISPLVRAFGPKSETFTPVVPAPRRSRAVLVGLVVVLIGVVAIVGIVMVSSSPTLEPGPPQPVASAEDAHNALVLGDHRRAGEIFASAAGAAADENERRRLDQWQRQAALIADLSAIGLPEMVRRVPGTPEDVWQSTFRKRYSGTALLFDALMYRDATGQYSLDYSLFDGDKEIRIAWEELDVLRGLPMAESIRVILGGRITDAERTPAGWVIHLRADSGVLFTDEEVFVGTSLPPVDDGTREVLRRQTEWLQF